MKRAKALLRILAVILAVILAALILYRKLESPPGTGRNIEFTLERGWGVRTAAAALEDSSLVRSRWAVLLRYRRHFSGGSLQAGRYALSDTMPIDTMLTMFTNGDVIPVPTVWVTLAPGLRREESLALLSRSMGFTHEELESLSRDNEFLSAMSVPSLEGYLFPETYEFADTLRSWQVVNRIVATGQRVMDQEWEAGCEAIGLTPFQGVILASIVEREAASDPERDLVAGVFINRLRRGMRLESCATVQYALGEVREQLLFSDLEIESPYNTYRNNGLPPGPICSPGTASLLAVTSPDTTDGYLFFVSKGDGSGEHLFATTAAGHARNINAVR